MNPTDTPTTKSLYCAKCGKQLVLVKGYPKVKSYSRYSGEGLFIYVKRCPKYKWYNGHDTTEFVK